MGSGSYSRNISGQKALPDQSWTMIGVQTRGNASRDANAFARSVSRRYVKLGNDEFAALEYEFHVPSEAVPFFCSQIAQITSRPYNADT